MKLREGSLFSGYNGLGMAVSEVFGSEPVWFSEYEPPTKNNPKPAQGAAKILAHHWPDVPNLGDLTKIDWDAVEPVDILSGGFPCQDVSPAGKRAGLKPGTRSGLWNHMAYAISKLRPRYVVAENVRGLLSAEAHSDVEPCPWCLGEESGEPDLRALGAVLGDLADLGYDAQWCGLRAADIGAPHPRFRVFILATDAGNNGRQRRTELNRGPVGGIEASLRNDPDGRGDAAADAHITGLEGRGVRGGSAGERLAGPGRLVDWGDYGPAIDRWERILGRVAPAPKEPGHKGGERLAPRFVEWMQGLPAGHVTDVPGVNRNAQLKALGNGVVPQQAAAALRHLVGAA